MSRIGRKPVAMPKGVEVKVDGSHIAIKGPKGQMEYTFPSDMTITMENEVVSVHRPSDDRNHRALHGMTRALINNMVVGVSTGFKKVLEIEGVGYRAEMAGKNLMIYVGFSHPIVVEPPQGISFIVDTKTRQITVSGCDKQSVGQVSADIRKLRPPEPYKGKGIHYLGEKIRRKAGKTGKV